MSKKKPKNDFDAFEQLMANDKGKEKVQERQPSKKSLNEKEHGAKMTTLATEGKHAQVLELWDKWQEEGSAPTALILSAALRSCAALKLYGKVDEIWNIFLKAGFQPDRGAYGARINSLLFARNYDEIISVFDQMTKAGISPLANNLFAILTAYFAQEKWADVVSTYEKFPKVNLAPDDKICNRVLFAYTKLGRKDKVDELVKFMKSKNMKPDINGSSTQAAVKSTQQQNNNNHYNQRQKPPANVAELNARLEEHIRNGQLEEANSLYNFTSQIKPNNKTYGLLIRIFAFSGRAEQAEALYKKMNQMNIPMDIETANAALKMMADLGSKKQFFKLLEDLPMIDLAPDENTYKIAILYAASISQEETVDKYYDKLLGLGFSPDIETCIVMMKMYASLGEFKKVQGFYAQLGARREINLEVYNTMLLLIGRRWYQKAEAIYQDMLAREVQPNEDTYYALIDAMVTLLLLVFQLLFRTFCFLFPFFMKHPSTHAFY